MNISKEEYMKQLRIELHKPAKKKFAKRKIHVKGKDDTWSMDLVDMTGWADWNNGYKWMLNSLSMFGLDMLGQCHYIRKQQRRSWMHSRA